jgi:hypothetical protein
MTKTEYLEAAAARYDELEKLNQLNNFYDYEVEFVKIWNGLGREVLEKSLGTLSKDKRKKKPHDTGLCDHK